MLCNLKGEISQRKKITGRYKGKIGLEIDLGKKLLFSNHHSTDELEVFEYSEEGTVSKIKDHKLEQLEGTPFGFDPVLNVLLVSKCSEIFMIEAHIGEILAHFPKPHNLSMSSDMAHLYLPRKTLIFVPYIRDENCEIDPTLP